MKILIVPFLGLAIAAVPVLALPTNCTAGTYTSYIALGSTGCQDGAATFNSFSAPMMLATDIPGLTTDDIEVIPDGTALAPTLTFVYLNPMGAPSPVTVNQNGQLFTMGISYQLILSGATLSSIQMNSNFSNTTPGSASSSKTAQIGSGPMFISTVSDQGSSNTLGNHAGAVTATSGAGVWTIGDGVSLQAQNGSATQASFENLFSLAAGSTPGGATTVPETGTVLSIGIGLLCIGLAGRRRMKLRG